MASELKYPFCPKCGQAMKAKTIETETLPVCQNPDCGFISWQNSKPCVSVLLTNEQGQLMLTERGIEPEKGKLDLPGGFLKEGEHPEAGAKREIQEELGVEVTIEGYLGFVVDQYGEGGDYTLNIGVIAQIVSGEPKPADDVAAIVWVDPRTVDKTKLAFTNNAKFLQMWVEKQYA